MIRRWAHLGAPAEELLQQIQAVSGGLVEHNLQIVSAMHREFLKFLHELFAGLSKELRPLLLGGKPNHLANEPELVDFSVALEERHPIFE